MERFFRNNVLGLLVVSACGSWLATIISGAFPSPVADGAWWRSLLFQPVPAVVPFLYTLVLVGAVATLAKTWQKADHDRHETEKSDVSAQLDSTKEELRLALREKRALQERIDARTVWIR